MHPRGAIRSPGKGAGTFLATQELSRQCQELGQLLGTAADQRKIRQAAPKPGLCLTAQLQEPLQSFVCKPCGRAALPWNFLQLCFTPTDIKQPAWRAGMGEGPCWGSREVLVGKRLSEENRKVASGKGSSLHTGRLFLIRACLDWSHPHCTSTSTPLQPAQGFLLFPAGQRSCTPQVWARADAGTAHPTPKGTGGTLRLPGCCLQASLISSQQSEGPVSPVSPAWPCHLSPPQPLGSRGTRGSCSKALSSLPAFPALRLPEQPRELQAQSVTFSKSLSLLSLLAHRAVLQCWGVQEAPGSGQRQCQDGPGGDGSCSPTPATSLLQLKGLPSQSTIPEKVTPHRHHRQGAPGWRMLVKPTFPRATGRMV